MLPHPFKVVRFLGAVSHFILTARSSSRFSRSFSAKVKQKLCHQQTSYVEL
jgi:hypothetical protein